MIYSYIKNDIKLIQTYFHTQSVAFMVFRIHKFQQELFYIIFHQKLEIKFIRYFFALFKHFNEITKR